MNQINYIFFFLLLTAPLSLAAQSVAISDFEKEDTRDINFEIVGKINNNILVYKNIRSKHKINIFDKDMNTLETVRLDFIPDKTFNIDFITYPDHFYMIYQYHRRNILYCMAVKMDAKARKIDEPVELDTTRIPVVSNTKIYSTLYSEDRKKIMIFKIQTRYQKFNMQTLLFDDQLKLIDKNRNLFDYNESKEIYDNFLLGNDGSFIFTYTSVSGNRNKINTLGLLIKAPLQNSFAYTEIDLEGKYIDKVNLKIDNRNNRYLINSFYYKKNLSSFEGLFTYISDRTDEKKDIKQFAEIDDSIRTEAKSSGLLQFALDNFSIHQAVVKADGGFILSAEDYTFEISGNNDFNRYNYNNPYSYSSGGYYYNPYTSYYRPFNSFNYQTTRYYYENILVLGISKTGKLEWGKVLQKSQFDDNDENLFLSFSTMTSGGEIHFLFNNDRKYQIVTNMGLTPDGAINRYPTLKSDQRGYEFMPGLSKQVGSNQIIIPCAYHNNLCFAKVNFN